jgi:hypothetical protein
MHEREAYTRARSAKEALILLVIPESRSEIRDPVTLHFHPVARKSLDPGFCRDDGDGFD